MIEGFLLGVIVTASLTSGLYFLKFWKRTGDQLFLAFAAAFLIEGLNRIGFDHAFSSGFDRHFAKPVDFDSLLQALTGVSDAR